MISIFLRAALAGLAFAGTAVLAQGGTQVVPAVAPAIAWPQDSSDLAADRDVRFGTLPNGMRYALRRNATPPGGASIRLRIALGSINEAEDQRGLAHFLEHMVLNGSANVPEGEFMRRLERHGLRMGADTNALTDWTQTVFKLDLPQANAEAVDTALFLLREVAGEASLTQPAIDAERGVIQAELRARGGLPLNLAQSEMNHLLPGQLAARRFPGGLPEVIAAATREQLVALYNGYYRPERATLIMVGDFDLDQMERQIGARFGNWRGRGPAGGNPDLGMPARRRTEARLHVEAGAPARVSLAWMRPPDRRPDSIETRAARLTDQLVLQILNRRLERIAATQSPAPFVAGFGVRVTMLDSGDLTQLFAIVQPGQWQAGLRAIETERHRLVAEGITRDEFDRELQVIANTLSGATIGAATRPSAETADAILTAVDQNKVVTSAEEDEILFEEAAVELSVRRVNRAARAMLSGDPLIFMTSPTPVAEGEATMLAAYREAAGTRVTATARREVQPWPYTDFGTPGTVAERRVLPAEIGATAIRFANGVRLTVKQTEYSDDHILIAVRVGRGRLDLPVDRPFPAWALPAALLGGGFGRISSEDMQETLSGRAFAYSVAVGDDAFLLNGSARSGDVPLQLQILAAQVTDPGWQASGWDRIRGLTATAYDAFEATPSAVLARDGQALLHGGDPRWATPSREEMAATTIADIRALLAQPLARGALEVIIVGDISVDDAIRDTAATFGALPARSDGPAGPPDPAPPVRFPAVTAEPVRLTHAGQTDQAFAVIAWPTSGYFAALEQARALDLLADVFASRLRREVRERQGTSYAPYAIHDASRVFPGYGVIMGGIDARPEALTGFLRDAEQIAADLREHPVDADELRRATQPRVEALLRDRNSNEWWLRNLARIQQDPRVAAAIASEAAGYRAITPAELQAAARRFLTPDRAWKLVIVPRERTAASGS